VAQLIVNYSPHPPFEVPVDRELYLDRHFLSGPQHDASISREPSAPCLRHRDGDWWLDNDATAHNAWVAVQVGDHLGRVVVPQRCSFRLSDGEVEVWVWKQEYRLRLAVSGSALRLPVVAMEGDLTEAGVAGADLRVSALWRRSPIHQVVLAAHYRAYFVAGLELPKPQSRDATLRCMGHHTATQLTRALRETMYAVWQEQGHGEELPEYLISRRLLTIADLELVPHASCAHPRPHRGR
jgi:hypothetical protein